MAKENNPSDIAQMEEKLRKLEHTLQRRYSEMGKGLLEMADQEQREIDRLVDEMIAIRKELAQAKNELRCESCTAFNPPDSNYCRRCGAKLPAIYGKKENENGIE